MGRSCAADLFVTPLRDNSASTNVRVGSVPLEITSSTSNFHVSGGRGSWGHREYGFRTLVRVGDRPAFEVERSRASHLLTEDELRQRLQQIRWSFSPDGEHLLFEPPGGTSRTFHFLREGPGFSVEDQTLKLGEWPTSETLAFKLSRDPRHCGKNVEFWQAVDASGDRVMAAGVVATCMEEALTDIDDPTTPIALGLPAALAQCARLGETCLPDTVRLGILLGGKTRADVFALARHGCIPTSRYDPANCYLVSVVEPFADKEERAGLEKACGECMRPQ